jgi:hypothetical protein
LDVRLTAGRCKQEWRVTVKQTALTVRNVTQCVPAAIVVAASEMKLEL